MIELDQDWGSEDAPWFEIDNFSDIILDKVRFLDILDKCGIEYFETSAGNFTHKGKCPLPSHLNGKERTASFYISEENNSFYCFGCNAGSTVIDFVILYNGVPFYKALEKLAVFAGITSSNIDAEELFEIKEKRKPEFTIMPYMFKTGVAIREHLKQVKGSKNYGKWLKWSDKKFRKMNIYINKLNNEQWSTAKDFYKKTTKFIDKHKK